ncbi:MAG: DUF503 domain-containing protein [Trueperaceae bacterium]|nr:DUF503 domain-containing protein [Trueperaceae bacterium]
MRHQPAGQGEAPVWIGVLTITAETPSARSRKHKRGMIAPLVERLRTRFPFTVARVGGQEALDHEVLVAVTVSGDPEVCRALLQRATTFAEGMGLTLRDVRSEVERWD